jgi:hypothetical protein
MNAIALLVPQKQKGTGATALRWPRRTEARVLVGVCNTPATDK